MSQCKIQIIFFKLIIFISFDFWGQYEQDTLTGFVTLICMGRFCVNITSSILSCRLVSFHSSVKSPALSQCPPHTHTCLSPSMLPRVTVEKHTQTSCRKKWGGEVEHTMQCSNTQYDTTRRACPYCRGVMLNLHTDSQK